MDLGISDGCPSAIQGPAASIFLTLINALMSSKCSFSTTTDYPSDFASRLQNGDSFDFIVVGAGSAGSVVASRLSENSNWKILLIEAGTYPSAESEIPSISALLQRSKEDWQYECELSNHLRFKDKINCPRGKGLGGSSLINYMVYFRGNRYDYDKWAQNGNVGWDYNSLVPYFRKFENSQDKIDNGFGKHGELKITKSFLNDPILPHLINAYSKLGYNSNYNEENPLGTVTTYTTILKGKRYSAAKAFLGAGVKDRKNLFVALNSQVSKLLIDSSLSVRGVEMRVNDKMLKIYANKEVILSAGSVSSPQILMNSGVGPKEHLENLGIKLIKNLKVGENLQDHIHFSGINFKLHESALTPLSETQNIDSLYNYFVHSQGPLGTIAQKFQAFVNTNNNSKTPSLQIYHLFQPKGILSFPLANMQMKAVQFPESVIDSFTKANILSNSLLFTISLAYPRSKGRILLRSTDPFEKPLIYTNYLSDNKDVIDLINGVKFVQKLMKSECLKEFTPELIQYKFADCDNFTLGDDNYWDCLIRNLVRTIYHLVGTCKMGPKNDPDAVVDARLKVHGIKNLRVIDGSIMPNLVGTNTNGPIIMIGEKGSEMIIEDWKSVKKDEL